MEKKCSKCGTVFTCKQETGGCWCEQFTLSKEMLHYLKEQYENCLCPECLHEFSEEKQGSAVNENLN
jgi:hypothetical protein